MMDGAVSHFSERHGKQEGLRAFRLLDSARMLPSLLFFWCYIYCI
jgi:hypothetical protein